MNEHTFSSLEEAAGRFKCALADLDADALVAGEPARVLEVLCGVERAVAAVRGRVAERAEQTNAWIGSGQRSAEAWLAGVTGTTVGDAKRTLETAEQLDGLPAVADALANGEVSEAQARQIAATGPAAVSHETELVETAGRGNFRQLRDRCRQLQAEAETASEEKARLARMHRRRGTRWWTEPDGAHVVQARFGPTQGPIARAHHDAELDAIFRLRRTGNHTDREPVTAYGTDAMFNLLCGLTVDGTPLPNNTDTNTSTSTGTGSGDAATPGRHLRIRPEIVILIDYQALQRGTTKEGETCELVGHGPIPVELAHHYSNDAFIKAVITNGTDITTVKHFGRSLPAELQTALMVRDRGCAVPDCTNTLGLEVDHTQPFAAGGELSLANAVTLCRPHHHQKTHNGHTLTGPPHQRTWKDKHGTTLSTDPDPVSSPAPPGPARDATDTRDPESSGALQLQLE